jgi:lysophospholipase L1-like esterase
MENLSEGALPQPADVTPRWNPRRRRYLFIGLTLAILFVVQESLFRFLFPVPEVLFNRADYMIEWLSPDVPPTRSKALCNVITRWECEPDGFSFDHTLNLYGFRGPNFAIAAPADRPRILFVGDSFVEGCGASDDDTLPRQFADLIAGEAPAEVLNLGVAGANFPEYLRLMLDAVPLLRPHTVFLVVYTNDLPATGVAALIPPRGQQQRIFARLDPCVPRIMQAVSLLNDGWVLPRRWHSGPYSFFAAVPSPMNPFTHDPRVEGLDPELERAMRAGKTNPFMGGLLPRFEQNLRRDYDVEGGVVNVLGFLSRFCREHGVQLNVLYIPFHVAANRDYLAAQVKLGGCAGFKFPASFSDEPHRAQQRHLDRACRQAGLPFVDTTDAFIAGERERRLFWPTDTHCNAAGYHLVAEKCARCWSAQRNQPNRVTTETNRIPSTGP